MGKKKKSQVFDIAGFVSRTHARCPDCEYRGDLDSVGKPYSERWGRVHKCQECGGRGEIPLAGIEKLDPMARKK